MGKKDIAEKHLEEHNDVFADIVNVLLFQGAQRIKEETLEDTPSLTMYKSDNSEIHEQERDISKFWKQGQLKIALYGFENQTSVDENMPLRIIGYDGQSYRSQLLKKSRMGKQNKKIKKHPVITLVLYFGTKRWKKPKSLCECLDIPSDLKAYVSDYRIHVFEISYLTDEQVAMFQSDFKFVADYFVQLRKNGDYIPSKETMKHVDSVLKTMSALTNDNRFLIAQQEQTGGIKSMCEVLDRAEKRGELRGIEIGLQQGENRGIQIGLQKGEARGIEIGLQKGKACGIEQGEARLSALINKLIADGDTDAITKVTTDKQIRDAYYRKYEIS